MTKAVTAISIVYGAIAVFIAIVSLWMHIEDGYTTEGAFQEAIIDGVSWPLNLLLMVTGV
jgi:hypothetical protein